MGSHPAPARRSIWLFLLFAAVLGIAFYLRASGLFRDLENDFTSHPDTYKQIQALIYFLQGRYHWGGGGSPFYDGYPFGLNHVDEWLLRPVRAIAASFFDTELLTSRTELFYFARSLRVFYGMVTLIVLMATARRLGFTVLQVALTGLLFAVAPIAVDVAHFASGDIGVDLFSGLSLLMLVVFAQNGGRRYLFLSAFAVGCAFSCKYNGMLAGIPIGLYLVGAWLLLENYKVFLLNFLIVAFAVLAGILTLTPAFLIAGRQHLEDVLNNFAFIKNYAVPEAFLQLPLSEQITINLTRNIPFVGGAMGWPLLALAATGLSYAAARLLPVVFSRKPCPDPVLLRGDLLLVSLFLFPFLALIISITGKPNVQPFHFSYLLLPVILAAVYGFDRLRVRRWSGGTAALLLLGACLIQFAHRDQHNDFFWKRMDNNYVQYAKYLLFERSDVEYDGLREPLNSVRLEPANSAVFRNRKSDVLLHNGQFWRQINTAPVPGVPYPGPLDWLFLNGATLPVNDRMFHIHAGSKERTVTKYLVLYQEPQEMTIGLRSGGYGVDSTIELGGRTRKIHLDAQSAQVVRITPKRWRRVAGMHEFGHDVWFLRLDVTLQSDDLWVTVLDSPQAEARFALFSGEAEVDPGKILPLDRSQDQILPGKVDLLNYLQDRHIGIVDALAVKGDREIGFIEVPLAAGIYQMECMVNVLSKEGATLEFYIDDAAGKPGYRIPGATVQIAPSTEVQSMRVRLAKPFAPYQCHIKVIARQGAVRFRYWTIRPDTALILEQLRQYQDGAQPPAWLKRDLR